MSVSPLTTRNEPGMLLSGCMTQTDLTTLADFAACRVLKVHHVTPSRSIYAPVQRLWICFQTYWSQIVSVQKLCIDFFNKKDQRNSKDDGWTFAKSTITEHSLISMYKKRFMISEYYICISVMKWGLFISLFSLVSASTNIVFTWLDK